MGPPLSTSFRTCLHLGFNPPPSLSESPEADCPACFLLHPHTPSSSFQSQTHLPSRHSSTGCTLVIPIISKTISTEVSFSGRVSPATSSIFVFPPTSRCSWGAGIATGSYRHHVPPITLHVRPTMTMNQIWTQNVTVRIATITIPLRAHPPTTRCKGMMNVIVGVHGMLNRWCNCVVNCASVPLDYTLE